MSEVAPLVRLDVSGSRWQCPKCGTTIDVVERAAGADPILRLEPCGHMCLTDDL